MRKPVLDTLRTFTPILIAGLGYFLYEEAPVIEREVEKAETLIEKESDVLNGKVESLGGTVADKGKELDKRVDETRTGTAPEENAESKPAPPPEKRRRPRTPTPAPPPF
jgi:hypothetical protein